MARRLHSKEAVTTTISTSVFIATLLIWCGSVRDIMYVISADDWSEAILARMPLWLC